MKFSRDWLSDYVDLTGISDAELAERFTNIGHAVDSIEKHDDDTVFDLEITTNRVDAMSHLGMARELAAAFGRELRNSASPTPAPAQNPAVKIVIEAPQMSSRYTAIAIRGITIKESPFHVQRRRSRRHHGRRRNCGQ